MKTPLAKKGHLKPLKDIAKTNLSSQHNSLDVSCYEGEHLSELLTSMQKEVELGRQSNKTLPDKLWIKQQFAVGVNEVTRALERMPSSSAEVVKEHRMSFGSPTHLQAVLVAWDCNPKWLIKHLPSLAASRNVPVIYVKDKKRGSIRLGELIKLKTAIAIGVKAKGNGINRLVDQILSGEKEAVNIDLVPLQSSS